ncbi:nicotinate-nucleotide pyrophosphorylase [carboxylating], partial [Quercus suber]
MARILSVSPIVVPCLFTTSRRIVRVAVTARNPSISFESMALKPPLHPTYDLKGIINLALAEDAGGQGDVTSMATIPADMEVEANFLAKEDGIIAGIALAEMVFREVDPSLKRMSGIATLTK